MAPRKPKPAAPQDVPLGLQTPFKSIFLDGPWVGKDATTTRRMPTWEFSYPMDRDGLPPETVVVRYGIVREFVEFGIPQAEFRLVQI